MNIKLLVPGRPYKARIDLFDGSGITLCTTQEHLIFKGRKSGFPWGTCFEFSVFTADDRFLKSVYLSKKQVDNLDLK